MTILGQGSLSAGMWQDLVYYLQGGVDYTIYVQAETPTAIFDLDIFDQDANKLDTSPIVGYSAAVQVTPIWTGAFTIRVKCLRGTGYYSLNCEP